jgi:hypothetical protein
MAPANSTLLPSDAVVEGFFEHDQSCRRFELFCESAQCFFAELVKTSELPRPLRHFIDVYMDDYGPPELRSQHFAHELAVFGDALHSHPCFGLPPPPSFSRPL